MKTINDTSKSNGSHLQGYMKASYNDLVKVFGNPTFGPNAFELDKVTCEWILEYEDNKYCTIYDWKIEETPSYEYQWHIGGFNKDCVDAVKIFFERNK